MTDAPEFDSAQFCAILGHFPTGVTVVTGMSDERPVGTTIGSFTSVSLDPPLVGFLPMTSSETWAAIAPSGRFCVNVLSKHQTDLCWTFARSDDDTSRFDGVSWRPGATGSPIIERAVAWIECTVQEVFEMGDHFFVLGRVVALDADPDGDGDGPHPLLFFRGRLGEFRLQG